MQVSRKYHLVTHRDKKNICVKKPAIVEFQTLFVICYTSSQWTVYKPQSNTKFCIIVRNEFLLVVEGAGVFENWKGIFKHISQLIKFWFLIKAVNKSKGCQHWKEWQKFDGRLCHLLPKFIDDVKLLSRNSSRNA